MVREVATVDVLEGHHEAFAADLATAAATVLPQAAGFVSFEAFGWCVEEPNCFMFTITWNSVADHMDGFRNSELFAQWRALIGPHFAAPPSVVHYQA